MGKKLLKKLLEKIVSGGQTGADRAALDVAMKFGIETGDWCRAGRGAEDGIIADCHQLTETKARNYRLMSDTSHRSPIIAETSKTRCKFHLFIR